MEFTKARLLKLPPQVEEPLAKTTGKKHDRAARHSNFALFFTYKKTLKSKVLL